jgi:biotin carboxylase
LDTDGAVTRIAEACRQLSIDLVFPVTDDIGLPLASDVDRVPASVLLPDPLVLHAVTDKEQTLRLAAACGVPVPLTVAAHSVAEGLKCAHDFGWPVVVKPRISRSVSDGAVRVHEVAFAWSETELAARIEPLLRDPGVLLQQYVVGRGVGVELLLDRGRMVAAFQHRRLHEVPLTGGASALRESVPIDPELLDYSVRLLGRLEWTGLAMVEYRVGPAGAALMEINGRPWGSLPLAVMAGVDFPAMSVALATGRRTSVPAPGDYRVGLRARNLELEALWIAAVLRGGGDARIPLPGRSDGLRGLVGLLDPRVRDDVLSIADPLPGLVVIERVVAKLASKARRSGSSRA